MALNEIEKLICPHLVGFAGYTASKAPEALKGKVDVPVENIIKLDANENPYGCSPRVQQALANYAHFNIYPDTEQREIKKLLQDYTGIEAKYIVAGDGSDQLIDLLFRLLVRPGDEVINCVPTFTMFRFFIELCSGAAVEVRRDKDFLVNTKAVKSAITKRTKIILLATPNNPTGTIAAREDIVEMLDTGVPVLVDEAYCEFTGQTVASLVPQYQNLIVLRTFSKWAGLAGLRIGYGIFPQRIAEYLMKIKLPYTVNRAALIAVRESLQDIEYLRGNIKAIVNERERLFAELKKFKFLKPYPSRANFIFCSVLNGKASELQQRLERRGILVRYFDQPLLRNSIRISVGKPEHTDALVKALGEIGADL